MATVVTGFNRNIVRTGYKGRAVTTPDHAMGWLLRALDHQPATGCKKSA